MNFYLDAVEGYIANILAAKRAPKLDEAVAFVIEAVKAGTGGNEAIAQAKAQGINPSYLYAALQKLNPQVYSGENGRMVLVHIMTQYGYVQSIPGGA